jgi:hypothetical protein
LWRDELAGSGLNLRNSYRCTPGFHGIEAEVIFIVRTDATNIQCSGNLKGEAFVDGVKWRIPFTPLSGSSAHLVILHLEGCFGLDFSCSG